MECSNVTPLFPAFAVELIEDDGITVAAVRGEADLLHVERMRAALHRAIDLVFGQDPFATCDARPAGLAELRR